MSWQAAAVALTSASWRASPRARGRPGTGAGACRRRPRAGAHRPGEKSSSSVVVRPSAERLVALRLERHDQADRRRDRARVERRSAELLVEHDRRGGGCEGAREAELERARISSSARPPRPCRSSMTRKLSRWSIASPATTPRSGPASREQPPAAVGGGRGHGRTSGRRGSGAIDGHRVRTQARSGSSVLAIVRRSPARALR